MPLPVEVVVAALALVGLWHFVAPKKERLKLTEPVPPGALDRLVMVAYRQALIARISTFFNNAICDPENAEKHFSDGLPGLVDDRDKALKILKDTKGI